jgi:hypothetical protein
MVKLPVYNNNADISLVIAGRLLNPSPTWLQSNGVGPLSWWGAWARLCSPRPSMMFAATQAAEVNHHGDNQNYQINARDRLMHVRHPRIDQCGKRQKQKAQQNQYEAVVRALQVIREEKQQHQGDSRKCEKDNQ